MSTLEFKSPFMALYSWVRGHRFPVILALANVEFPSPSPELDHIFTL